MRENQRASRHARGRRASGPREEAAVAGRRGRADTSPARPRPRAREELIVVDAHNRAIGRAEKWAVHHDGLLHRAFSIFLVDREGRVLLQQRSRAKYHSGGLWANSCCGHPRPGERTLAAAHRRLREELGAEAPLTYAFRAQYRTALPNGLTENEIVYVFFGPAPGALALEPAEVSAVAWATVDELQRDIARRPEKYAYWLRYYMGNHAAAVRRWVATLRRRQRTGTIAAAAPATTAAAAKHRRTG